MVLVQELRKRLGANLLDAKECEAQVDKLLREFDTNRSGTIEPDEFLKMMVRKPWSAMLPEDVIDQMPQAVAETLVESKPQKNFRKELQTKAAKEAASQAVIMAARKIFRSVDGDGNGRLDRSELGVLVQEMRKSMGLEYLNGQQIHNEVTDMLKLFDINRDGDISFDEFLRMIVMPPWCRLLPESVQGKLHEVVMDQVSDAPVHKRERDVIFRSAALEAASASVLRAARNIYREIDSNGDGQLDRDELRLAIADLWARVGDPLQSAEQLDVLTNNAMENFDDDKNGLISFKEFVKMISNPPWDQLLPPDVQAKMHNSMMDAHTDTKEQRERRDANFREAAVAAAAKASLKAAKELFQEVDGDGNGTINETELECLVLMVLERLGSGAVSISRGELRATATEVMDRFDTNGSGVIDFDEFIAMLCCHPWNKLLPEDVQGYLESKSRRRAASPMGKRAADETASAAVIRAARDLFIEVDMDGNGWIDSDELYWLLKKLQRRIGTTNSTREQLDRDVKAAMEAFDAGRTGNLNFHEFLRMITTEPWSQSLPSEVQRHLPNFVYQDSASGSSYKPEGSRLQAADRAALTNALNSQIKGSISRAPTSAGPRSSGAAGPRSSGAGSPSSSRVSPGAEIARLSSPQRGNDAVSSFVEEGGAPNSPTGRAMGTQLVKVLTAHSGFADSVRRVYEFYCSAGEYREMNTMRPRMFHKMVRDAGLLTADFTHDDACRVLEEAKPEHRPRLSREHFDSALVLLCQYKFSDRPAVDAVTALLENHIVPLDQDNLRFGADYHIHHPQVVDIAYEYDDFLRFVYFYYTQESRMMRFEDFMLFAEDFGVTPDKIEANDLGNIFQTSGNVVRAGHASYHEFVVCLSRCALRAGGSSALHAVNDFLETLIASDAYAGIEQWHRSLEWAPHGPNPQDWAMYKSEAPTRSQSPRARTAQGKTRGQAEERVNTPAKRSPSPYSRSAQAWEGALSSDSLSLLFQSAGRYNVDLALLFSQYATGASEMSASQFYQFAWDAQLVDNAADVDNFFLMAVGSHYRGALRISPDRFNAALVRVFENLSQQRGVDLARGCDTLIRDHVTPIVADRAARGGFGFAPGMHAYGGAAMTPYGYGAPMAPYGYAPAGFAASGAPVSSRGPMRAAERMSNGRISPR
jgi:Ca2+-binding EF-hand superfamily protein